MKSKTAVRNTLINALGTFLSRVSGIVKFNIVNYLFGAGSDTFHSANANILALRKVLGEGPLVNALLPVYSKLKTDNALEADQFASNIINQMVLISVIVTILGWGTTAFWTRVFLPGYINDTAAFNEIVSLTMVMLLSTVFFSTFSVSMAILNAQNRFVSSANAPILANIIFIIFPIFTYKSLGILSLGWAIVIGTALQALAEFIEMYIAGFRYHFLSLNFFSTSSKRFWKLFIPTAFTFLVQSGVSIGLGFFASFLPRGSMTYLRNANTIVQAPVGFIGTALASALFPLFASLKQDKQKLFKAWEEGLVFFLYLCLPITFFFIFYPDMIVNSIFRDLSRIVSGGTGLYSAELFEQTIKATGLQGSIIIPWSLSLILNKIYYSLEKPFLPLVMYALNFILTIAGYITTKNLGLGGMGLVLADLASAWLCLFISLIIISKSLPYAYENKIIKTLAGFLCLSIFSWLLLKPLHLIYLASISSPLLSIFWSGFIFSLGMGIFYGICYLLKTKPFVRRNNYG